MKYIGITQKTCNWLLSNTHYFNAFKAEIQGVLEFSGLSEGVVAVGALRITAFDNQVICIWNNDYLTGTGYEDWGFMRIASPLGLLDEEGIFEEVLERELFVINQRLQGMLLPDDRMIHRSHGEKQHTCLSGRGEKARHQSIGWFEDNVKIKNGSFHSLVCVGPSKDSGFTIIGKAIKDAGVLLPRLLEVSNTLLSISKSRPLLDIPIFTSLKDRFLSEAFKKGAADMPIESPPELRENEVSANKKYSAASWTYDDWIDEQSPLTKTQRLIVESDIILKQPVRIVGAAGTGKSLIMELLVIRRLRQAKKENISLSILFVVHNSEMVNTMWNRFEILGAEEFLLDSPQKLLIKTLFEYCCEELAIDRSSIIDKDASQTKEFQREIVIESIKEVFSKHTDDVKTSDLLLKINQDKELTEVFANLLVNEIGIAIKGRALTNEKQKYVSSERPFTRFHGVLNSVERAIIFDIYEMYRQKVFEDGGMLDSDDIAITFLGHLKTPLWEMKRKKFGFDFVFVDETQLFNENERRLFKFLSKSTSNHMPIVLALDEAQDLRGASNAGFGLLGIEHLVNEELPNVHRCTPAILRLAFFTISRTTDLFGTEFPDFTKNTTSVVSKDHPLAKKPRIVVREDASGLSKSILKEVRALRKENIRQIAIIIHAERYWNEIVEFLKKEDLPVVINIKRGELINPEKPIVYVTKPENVGGQEFGAVICVGLEHGIVPPIVNGHAGLSEALEQQALREIYLAFTRAKYQLVIVNSKNSSPSNVIQLAIKAELIQT